MAGEPDVALLMTVSGSLDILNFCNSVIFQTFCNFPSTRVQSQQQHHAAPKVALTVRNMLLKRIHNHHCLKLLVLLKNAHVSKLVALSVKILYGSHGNTIKNIDFMAP